MRKKKSAYFRRKAIPSVAETAKSITKTSITGSSKVQNSLKGVCAEQDSSGDDNVLSGSALRQ